MPTRRVLGWVTVLYLAQGLPYGVVSRVWPVYFRSHGVSLAEIGLLGLVALPWSWKPLWAPLVDRFGARRAWIAPCLAALAALVLTRSEGLFLLIVDENAEGLAGWKHHEHVVLRGILSRSGEPMGRPLLRVETVERSEMGNDSP
jgi:MFS family permease